MDAVRCGGDADRAPVDLMKLVMRVHAELRLRAAGRYRDARSTGGGGRSRRDRAGANQLPHLSARDCALSPWSNIAAREGSGHDLEDARTLVASIAIRLTGRTLLPFVSELRTAD